MVRGYRCCNYLQLVTRRETIQCDYRAIANFCWRLPSHLVWLRHLWCQVGRQQAKLLLSLRQATEATTMKQQPWHCWVSYDRIGNLLEGYQVPGAWNVRCRAADKMWVGPVLKISQFLKLSNWSDYQCGKRWCWHPSHLEPEISTGDQPWATNWCTASSFSVDALFTYLDAAILLIKDAQLENAELLGCAWEKEDYFIA